MKKNLTKKILIGIGAFSMLGGMSSIPMLAATADSDVSIQFTENLSPTSPVDPENPDLPGTGPGTGMLGPLSLDYVPDLDFGSHALTGREETFKTLNVTPYIQVTDTRGTGEGWEVKASMSELTDVDSGTKNLPAVIAFQNGSTATTSTNNSQSPQYYNFELSTGGDAVTVSQAAANQGMGTWVTRWLAGDTQSSENEYVTMTVDTANAYATDYSSTITWEIQTTP